MPTFTVHAPPRRDGEAPASPERFAFVRDGFHGWAFFFAPLWLIALRLWLALVLYVVVTAAVATASGQAALHIAFVTLADHGGNIVSVPQLYGATHTLLHTVLKRQGIEARFADDDSPAAIERLIDENTRAVFCESIGNPAGNICDIAALAEVAQSDYHVQPPLALPIFT